MPGFSKLRNDSNIISRIFVARNDWLGKWNSRTIPELNLEVIFLSFLSLYGG